jgi:hypothetical protein
MSWCIRDACSAVALVLARSASLWWRAARGAPWFKTCFCTDLVKYGQFARIAMWLLAVVLPGGLILLALWTSMRLVRERAAARTARPHLSLPSQPART